MAVSPHEVPRAPWGLKSERRGRQSGRVQAERSLLFPRVPSVRMQRSGPFARSQTGYEVTSSRSPVVPGAMRTRFKTRRKCRVKNRVPAP